MNSNTPPISSQPQFLSLAISEIILDPKINTRDIDNDVVLEYKEAIEGYGANWQDHWNELPRITGSKHLWSGNHTITAARLVFGERATIKCVVEGETYRDAYFLATRTNGQHGRRRSNAEKEAAVMRWLEDEEMCQWTDGYIARHCYVSDRFVGQCRLRTVRSQPTKRKFVNVQGEVEWMHTSRIGKNQAPPSPPASDAKQRKTDFQAYIKHRDAAYNAWEAYCELHEIPFDWESFCLHAEKYLDGEGCVSAINPEEATLDQIREKSLTWQQMKSAISHGVNWVVMHRGNIRAQAIRKQAKAEPIPAEEEGSELEDSSTLETEQVSLLSNLYEHLSDDELLKRYRDFIERNPKNSHRLQGYRLLRGTAYARKLFDEIDEIDKPRLEDRKEDESKPDREGLRKNLEAMVGSDTEPNPSILTKLYHVPEAEIHAEIEEVFGEEKKTDSTESESTNPLAASPKSPPKPFESTNVGIVFAAHNEAKEAYIKMMGGEPAEKVAEKYWDDFCDTAKKNAPRGKGLPKGKHDGTTVDRYPRDKAERIVECWEWIRNQCQPGLNNQAERDVCNLNLLKCDPPALWIQNWIYETCCKMSDFNIVMHGLNYESEIGRLEFKAPIPLGGEALERIIKATQEAVDFELQEILAEHNEHKEEANAPVATRLLTEKAPTP